MAEWLVDAGLPVVIVAQGQSMGPEVRGGMWFDGAGTLWGDISWHDGAIFSPIRGTILRITERLPDPGSLRRDATIELTVDAKASPVRKLTWFSPDD